MTYNFESFQDRRHTGSSKYELMLKENPNVSEGIVPMATADMEINTPPEVTKGLCEYIDGAILGYQVVTDSYLDAVISWFDKRYGYKPEKEWISPSPGVVGAFSNALRALAKEGEGVIVTPPVYGPFYMMVEGHDRKLVECPLIEEKDTYKMDFDKLEELAKDENNKVLLFCNPHNPSGRVWTKEELERIGQICLENDVYIISDEIHADFIRPEYDFVSFGCLSDEILDISIICTAPNKTFNIAGLKAGNTIIPNPELREIYAKEAMKNQGYGTNSLALKATEIAYTECEEWLDELLDLIYKNIDDFIGLMEEKMPEVRCFRPEGTYLVWMDMSGLGMDDEELDEFLKMKAELFINPGDFFRMYKPCYRRINLACPNYVVKDTVDRLEKAWKNKEK